MQLELKEVSVHYGRAIAVASISLKVDQGELVAVVGPNGTGKTTLLRAISGLVELEKGEIFFDGELIRESIESEFRVFAEDNSLEPHEIVQRGIIHCPERRRLFGESSVQENLELGAYARSDVSEIEKDFERVLNLFPDISGRLDEKAGNFSGGEQQMVALARALMGAPKLLLLDEPSLGLAPIAKSAIIDAIKEIQKQGTTILLVEQDASIALNIADRGYVLENGRIEVQGSRDELLSNSYIKEVYLGIGVQPLEEA